MAHPETHEVSYDLQLYLHLHVLCGVAQQSSKRDGIGYCSQVDEKNGRQRLDVQCIVEITEEKGGFSFDIKNKASTKPEEQNMMHVNSYTRSDIQVILFCLPVQNKMEQWGLKIFKSGIQFQI